MKIVLVCVAFFFTLCVVTKATSQKMVQTPSDLVLLCQNDGEFVGKPLVNLLNKLKPAVRMVFAEGGWSEVAPSFSFYFMTKQQFDTCRNANNTPLRLTVYTKEFFKWEYSDRRKYLALPFEWTKEDSEQYGNLTVDFIRVSGVCSPH